MDAFIEPPSHAAILRRGRRPALIPPTADLDSFFNFSPQGTNPGRPAMFVLPSTSTESNESSPTSLNFDEGFWGNEIGKSELRWGEERLDVNEVDRGLVVKDVSSWVCGVAACSLDGFWLDFVYRSTLTTLIPRISMLILRLFLHLSHCVRSLSTTNQTMPLQTRTKITPESFNIAVDCRHDRQVLSLQLAKKKSRYKGGDWCRLVCGLMETRWRVSRQTRWDCSHQDL